MSESRLRVPDKVKEVAKEDFDQYKQLASDAVRSAAYLYPFKVGMQLYVSRTSQANSNSGHRLLFHSSSTMEASRGQARTNRVARSWGDSRDVHVVLRPPGRSSFDI